MPKKATRIMCIVIALTMLLCFILPLVGCGKSVDISNIRGDVTKCVQDENSKTQQIIASTSDPVKKESLNAFATLCTISDVSYELDNETKQVTLCCTAFIPVIESLANAIANSEAFKSEYASVAKEDRQSCIYNYATNVLLANKDVEYKEINLSSVGINLDTAQSDLGSKYDSLVQQSLSDYALADLYDCNEKSESTISEKTPFIEAENLDDFVVKENGSKLAITNIIILQGDDALKKLQEISENNSLIEISPENQIVFIQYQITNLSKSKKVKTFENYFKLGNNSGTLYNNNGFHVEGLSYPTKIKYGETVSMTTALVGDVSCDLYFYDNAMNGPRHWTGVPVSKET